jgi:hypothetical protein
MSEFITLYSKRWLETKRCLISDASIYETVLKYHVEQKDILISPSTVAKRYIRSYQITEALCNQTPEYRSVRLLLNSFNIHEVRLCNIHYCLSEYSIRDWLMFLKLECYF